ncbi:MAG: hypothetical protein U1D65_06345 [Pseudomonas sp.]|nr:hypothetical protein [Pseudomonas sp.]MDZ4191609.1 hypothetical protein [Pseudomonas sp.]
MDSFKWALIPRSDLMDLCAGVPMPIAIFRTKEAAEGHGRRMYGEMFDVAEWNTNSALKAEALAQGE